MARRPDSAHQELHYYAGATRLAMREGSSLYYLLGDHLGSTSLVTDPGGVILSAARYDPWGELRVVSGPSQTRYGYTGQRAEKGLGLYFYGARWYDPQLSRFLSADSIIPQQQGVQAWDRFAYVSNNPLKYTDPSGHQATDIGSGSSSGTGGGTSSSQSTVDDDSSGLGLEDAGDGNPTIDCKNNLCLQRTFTVSELTQWIGDLNSSQPILIIGGTIVAGSWAILITPIAGVVAEVYFVAEAYNTGELKSYLQEARQAAEAGNGLVTLTISEAGLGSSLYWETNDQAAFETAQVWTPLSLFSVNYRFSQPYQIYLPFLEK